MVKIQVISGGLAGRYVGLMYRSLVTNPALHEEPPVLLDGTDFAFYAQERPATGYGEHAALKIQTQLKALGIKCELIGQPSSGPMNQA